MQNTCKKRLRCRLLTASHHTKFTQHKIASIIQRFGLDLNSPGWAASLRSLIVLGGNSYVQMRPQATAEPRLHGPIAVGTSSRMAL